MGLTETVIRWLWVSSTRRCYLVSCVFMRLNIGDMLLEQHLLYDKIINQKTTWHFSKALGAKTVVVSEIQLV